MENEAENINSQNDEVVVEETTLTVDDYNRVKEELEAEKAKNAKLYARVQKEKKVESQPLAKVNETGISSAEFTRLKLKVDFGISDPEALDFVMKNGGEKALENPYIKKTIDTMLEQKRAEQAVVSGSDGQSEVEKKFTQGQLKDMSAEELEKILPHA